MGYPQIPALVGMVWYLRKIKEQKLAGRTLDPTFQIASGLVFLFCIFLSQNRQHIGR